MGMTKRSETVLALGSAIAAAITGGTFSPDMLASVKPEGDGKGRDAPSAVAMRAWAYAGNLLGREAGVIHASRGQPGRKAASYDHAVLFALLGQGFRLVAAKLKQGEGVPLTNVLVAAALASQPDFGEIDKIRRVLGDALESADCPFAVTKGEGKFDRTTIAPKPGATIPPFNGQTWMNACGSAPAPVAAPTPTPAVHAPAGSKAAAPVAAPAPAPRKGSPFKK